MSRHLIAAVGLAALALAIGPFARVTVAAPPADSHRAETPAHAFVWAHFLEPHEPYEVHPGVTTQETTLGRYEGEIRAGPDSRADAGSRTRVQTGCLARRAHPSSA